MVLAYALCGDIIDKFLIIMLAYKESIYTFALSHQVRW